MSRENVELVRRAYEVFNRWGVHPGEAPLGNPEVQLLHPEIEFHTYVDAPEAGIYRGPDAVLKYQQRVFEQFESVRIELEELLPLADHVLVMSRQHVVPRGGQTAMVQRVIEVWTIRDRLLAERRSYLTKEQALEAVGLSE